MDYSPSVDLNVDLNVDCDLLRDLFDLKLSTEDTNATVEK